MKIFFSYTALNREMAADSSPQVATNIGCRYWYPVVRKLLVSMKNRRIDTTKSMISNLRFRRNLTSDYTLFKMPGV